MRGARSAGAWQRLGGDSEGGRGFDVALALDGTLAPLGAFIYAPKEGQYGNREAKKGAHLRVSRMMQTMGAGEEIPVRQRMNLSEETMAVTLSR